MEKGGIWVAGEFDKTAKFGSFELKAQGLSDIYLARYMPDGTWKDAITITGTQFEKMYGICAASKGGLLYIWNI